MRSARKRPSGWRHARPGRRWLRRWQNLSPKAPGAKKRPWSWRGCTYTTMPPSCMERRNEARGVEKRGARTIESPHRPRNAGGRQNHAGARAAQKRRARAVASPPQRAGHLHSRRRAEICHRWPGAGGARRRSAVHPPAHAPRGLGARRHRGPGRLRSSARRLAEQDRRLFETWSLTSGDGRSFSRQYADPPFSLLSHFRERAWTKGHGVVYRTYVAESSLGASPLKGSNMKRRFALAILLLGSVGVARAQLSAPALNSDRGSAAPDFAASSAVKAALPTDLLNPFARPAVTTVLALPLENAEPASPSPRPKFLYGGRDDYRWQLGLSASWLRFRSTPFSANAAGINTSVVYFTNDWFGVEANITAVFAHTIFLNEHVKIGTYGAGPKIAWRKKQWEPWLHGIFGGAQERPQLAGQSRKLRPFLSATKNSVQPGFPLFLAPGDQERPQLAGQSRGSYVIKGGG